MRLKVRCPGCGRIHLLRVEYLHSYMNCPSCGYDFIPAFDAVLLCPQCGSVVTSSGGRGGVFTCIDCGIVLPEPWLARVRRGLRQAFFAPHFSL